MNLLLLHDADIEGTTARVCGRRANHIKEVLKKAPGDALRAGVANRGHVAATVASLDEESVVLELGAVTPSPRPAVHVILAVPRPKALSRILSAVASFGAHRVTLINAWRVEKSYFNSPRLMQRRMLEDTVLGCEQGKQVWIPELCVERSFRRYLEDVEPRKLPPSTDRLVLHPDSHATIGDVIQADDPGRPVALALGPEGGFIDKELGSFERAGYQKVRLQTGPLKTEVALAAALGQLALLRPQI